MPTLTRPARIDLPDWRRDERRVVLAKRTEELDRRARELDLAIARSIAAIEDGEAAIEPLEVDILAGKAKPKAIDGIRGRIAAARQELASARAERAAVADEQRKMRGALTIVEDDGKQAARRALVVAYRGALARLDEAIVAASVASEDVFAIWITAEEMFPVSGRSPRGVYHHEAAGLIRGDWPELARAGGLSRANDPNPSKYDLFHEEVSGDALILAEPPPPPLKPTAPMVETPDSGQRRFTPDWDGNPAESQRRLTTIDR